MCMQLPTVVSFDRWTLAIGHFQLLDHDCGTARRPTYDILTLPFMFRWASKTYLIGD